MPACCTIKWHQFIIILHLDLVYNYFISFNSDKRQDQKDRSSEINEVVYKIRKKWLCSIVFVVEDSGTM